MCIISCRWVVIEATNLLAFPKYSRTTAGLQQQLKKGRVCVPILRQGCCRVTAAISSRRGPVIFFLQFCCCIPGFLQQFLQGVAQSFFSCNFAAAFLVLQQHSLQQKWDKIFLQYSQVLRRKLAAFFGNAAGTVWPGESFSGFLWCLLLFSLQTQNCRIRGSGEKSSIFSTCMCVAGKEGAKIC